VAPFAPLIYPATGAAALGLLSGEALDRIGSFHGQLADARQRLAEPGLRRLRSDAVPDALLPVHAFNHVEPWLSRLRPRLGRICWDEPDLADANALLGQLEQPGTEPITVAYCWVDCGLR
jgi:hypothetical protein